MFKSGSEHAEQEHSSLSQWQGKKKLDNNLGFHDK